MCGAGQKREKKRQSDAEDERKRKREGKEQKVYNWNRPLPFHNRLNLLQRAKTLLGSYAERRSKEKDPQEGRKEKKNGRDTPAGWRRRRVEERKRERVETLTQPRVFKRRGKSCKYKKSRVCPCIGLTCKDPVRRDSE